MSTVSTASLWSTEYAFDVARRIAALRGIYCGPAAVVWIAAVWNKKSNVPYDYLGRLQSKDLFADGPRSFNHTLPGFKDNLDETLRRETRDELHLSSKRYYRYNDIHRLIGKSAMPFIVRIPLVSVRDGLHYATIFKTEMSDESVRFYCQDNGVIKSTAKIQEGINVTEKSAARMSFFLWGARQIEIS